MEEEVIETALVPVNLFGARTPAQVIDEAQLVAEPLARLIRDRQLASSISGKEYVRIEGWTLLGSMLGVFPIVQWTRPVEGGWEARVEARSKDGNVVGAAEAECLRSEPNWQDRPDYAIRSMAQTRAASKALRLPLGFVMTLAGYEATPAEEMDGVTVRTATGPPCPHCGTPVIYDPKPAGRKPIWSCPNQGCGGGDLRDKEDESKGRWPWASWNPSEFKEEEVGPKEFVEILSGGERPAAVDEALEKARAGFGWPDAVWDEALARTELEAAAMSPRFAAGTMREIRDHVNRAVSIAIQLGETDKDVFADLWREWQGDDPARRGLEWRTAKASEVHSFARAVQAWLRGLVGK
uniref:Uncharacterized protein n=1 Tax=viral metagenome TaxID=1070528 RepID=A0A6M3LCQ9_9ZZZZ